MRFILLLIILIFNIKSSAQVPQGIPYQAVARNGQGQPLTNTNVKLRFSILDSTATGTAVYVESHSTTTSSLGLFTTNVGMGTASTGTFSAINWGQNYKFLKVELDTTATGNSYIDLGTQQMMSVPYALYAGSVGQDNSLNSSVSNNSGINLFFGGTLASGTYVVPSDEFWKITAVYTTSNYGSETSSYNLVNCYYAAGNTYCQYQNYIAPIAITIDNIEFKATLTNNSQYPFIIVNNCASCPTLTTSTSSFSFALSMPTPFWLEPGKNIFVNTNVRLIVEKYK
jgi:hypothetical protein